METQAAVTVSDGPSPSTSRPASAALSLIRPVLTRPPRLAARSFYFEGDAGPEPTAIENVVLFPARCTVRARVVDFLCVHLLGPHAPSLATLTSHTSVPSAGPRLWRTSSSASAARATSCTSPPVASRLFFVDQLADASESHLPSSQPADRRPRLPGLHEPARRLARPRPRLDLPRHAQARRRVRQPVGGPLPGRLCASLLHLLAPRAHSL